jgi:hypothetical protein
MDYLRMPCGYFWGRTSENSIITKFAKFTFRDCMKSSWRRSNGGSSVARNTEVEPCGAVFCTWWGTGSRPIRRFHTVSPLRWVNKDDHARLRFLVNEEHALAKPVRCSPEAGLGVHILRPTLFELLICGGNLAGRERFTSTGMHYDAHSSPTARSNGKTDHLLFFRG